MVDTDNNAIIDITIGNSEIHIEGSEKFVSRELSTVLEKVDIEHQSQTKDIDGQTSQESSQTSAEIEEPEDLEGELNKVADGLGVDSNKLKKHFFIDDNDLHIENPLNIPARQALLGYCTIENEWTGKTTFENRPMKTKLVEQEGVEIDEWGDFIYNARRRGDIRDDPSSSQQRNKPFRLTRDGRDAFLAWLENGNEDD